MSKYRELPKLKKGEGKMYSVRFNLGENYAKPYGMQRKIWTMSFDERGAFWTRLLRAKNRTDAVNRMLIWYRNKKHVYRAAQQLCMYKLFNLVDFC